MGVLFFLDGVATGILFTMLSASLLASFFMLYRYRIIFYLFFGLVVLLGLVASFHTIPGLVNLTLYDSVLISEGSRPIDVMANLDKPLAGLSLLIVFFFLSENKMFSIPREEAIKQWILTPFYVLLILMIGWLTGLSYDFKISEITAAFFITNLLFSVVTEEVFFRGFIQGQIYNYLSKKTSYSLPIAIAIASFLFGLAHLSGGVYFFLLATIAGGFYGMAYCKTGKLSASILVHSGTNIGHFIFLEYPVPY
jgi:membrane protease YdiL (CAAX protease family)